jgi:murein DD-endopeptidase MepM/ murein hydrolase activator NlpD
MRLRTGQYLLALLAGMFLVSCNSDGILAEFSTPTMPVVEAKLPSIIPSDYLNPTSTAPPKLPMLEGQVISPSSPTPVKVELPLIQNAAPLVVCSPLTGIDLIELPEIISSPYDPPPPGKEDRHHGIDFAFYRRGDKTSIQGTGVQALLPGVVVMALEDSFPYGNVVIVESSLAMVPTGSKDKLDFREGESLFSLVAHLEDIPLVEVGQDVAACQLLGTVGKSGNAGVAHLHLETRLGPSGIVFDSMGFYLAESNQREKENYLRWRISGEFRHFNPLTLLVPSVPP